MLTGKNIFFQATNRLARSNENLSSNEKNNTPETEPPTKLLENLSSIEKENNTELLTEPIRNISTKGTENLNLNSNSSDEQLTSSTNTKTQIHSPTTNTPSFNPIIKSNTTPSPTGSIQSYEPLNVDNLLIRTEPESPTQETPPTQYDLRIQYEILQNSQIIESDNIQIPFQTENIEYFRSNLEQNFRKSPQRRNLSNWSFDDKMPTPIKDITDLIKEYKGEEKHLNSFVKNIDKLWNHINDHDNADKDRFLLVLQIKLTEKAAEAVKDVEFNNWPDVKKALKEKIKPQKNVEKAELKLTTVKQTSEEDLEIYAKRVENLMDDLNQCFELEEGYEVIKKENIRKARKSFENGLYNTRLRNKAIARGCANLKDVVDYVIEQELRLSETRPTETFCNYCKIKGHNISECRKKVQPDKQEKTPTKPKLEVTCYKCNRKGHYAPDCRSYNRSLNQNSPSTSYQNTYRNPSQSSNQNFYRNSYQNSNQGSNQNFYRSSYQNSNQNSYRNSYQASNQNPNQNSHQNANFRNTNQNNNQQQQRNESFSQERNNGDNSNPKNIRLFETEVPIETAIAEIEMTKN